MKNLTRHIGTLTVVERLHNSRNGNPRYLLQVAGFTCRTPVDSQMAYTIESLDGKTVDATIGTFRGVATLNTVYVWK